MQAGAGLGWPSSGALSGNCLTEWGFPLACMHFDGKADTARYAFSSLTVKGDFAQALRDGNSIFLPLRRTF